MAKFVYVFAVLALFAVSGKFSPDFDKIMNFS